MGIALFEVSPKKPKTKRNNLCGGQVRGDWFLEKPLKTKNQKTNVFRTQVRGDWVFKNKYNFSFCFGDTSKNTSLQTWTLKRFVCFFCFWGHPKKPTPPDLDPQKSVFLFLIFGDTLNICHTTPDYKHTACLQAVSLSCLPSAFCFEPMSAASMTLE